MINFQPGIYKVSKESSGYALVPYAPRFDIVGKDYGDITKHREIIWNSYMDSKTSTGAMFIGRPGSGKTRIAEQLANIAIDNNHAVVSITEIKFDLDLIKFIDGLYNTVVLFDEFGKNVNISQQQHMLTMLSNNTRNKKLFLITENNKNAISSFILSRPGRIRYCIDYDRVKSNVIEEYCADYNVTGEFYDKLLDLHSRAVKFSFDHLQTLISEHIRYPELELKELLEILNLGDLTKPKVYKPVKAVSTKDDSEWDIVSGDDLTETKLDYGRYRIWVDVKQRIDPNDKSDTLNTRKVVANNITPDMLVSVTDDTINYENTLTGFKITFMSIEQNDI